MPLVMPDEIGNIINQYAKPLTNPAILNALKKHNHEVKLYEELWNRGKEKQTIMVEKHPTIMTSARALRECPMYIRYCVETKNRTLHPPPPQYRVTWSFLKFLNDKKWIIHQQIRNYYTETTPINITIGLVLKCS